MQERFSKKGEFELIKTREDVTFSDVSVDSTCSDTLVKNYPAKKFDIEICIKGKKEVE